MATLYLTHDSGILGRKGTALTWGERSGPRNTIPSTSVEDVIVLGNGTVSTQAIRLLLEQDVPLHYLNGSGRYLGSLTSGKNRGRNLRKKQEECASSPGASLPLARGCVVGKILNQRKNLVRATYKNRRSPSILNAINELAFNASLAGTAENVEKLRGIEGASAALYFSVFEELLPSGWFFNGRNRRPPKDPVNALLSFAYTLLLTNVVTSVIANCLDPAVGFLHPEYRGRPSAALDLMEEFRPCISDRIVLAVINQGIISPCDFSPDGAGGIHMNAKARTSLLKAHAERLSTSGSAEKEDKSVSYCRRIFLQGGKMASAIWEGKDYLPYVVKK